VQYQSHDRIGANIRITKLIIQESGTYNDMYSRPYNTHVTADTLGNIMRRVDENKGRKISGTMFAGVASGIIGPSSSPQGIIPIPMGWSDRRMRFIMEVTTITSTGSEVIYYFQGYTTHVGIDAYGNFDPQMEFILNSYTRVNRIMKQGPYGASYHDVVTESAQVVNGAIVNQVGNNTIYNMRPYDIFTGIQSSYLENAYSSYTNKADTLKDTRITMTGEPLLSKRNNGISGSYVAKIVDDYQSAMSMADFGQGQADILTRCQHLSGESKAYENPVIRALSNIRGTHACTSFSYNNLKALDSNVEHVTNFITLGNTRNAQLHEAGQTSHWHGSDRETIASTILSNAVPGVMMDLMLSSIHFRSTNHDAGGVINTVLIGGKGLTNADLSKNYEIFKRRFETEIMFDITFGNQVLYTLEMTANLFGDTRITISLDSGPAISYTTPSFCDSLLTPVISMNENNYRGVVHDFEVIMNAMPKESSKMEFNSLV
jgi:hypothetical protein